MDQLSTCPKCQLQILPAFYFCPNCGKQLRDKPLSLSVLHQIGIYLLSALLPPLGVWPGIKYLSQKDTKAKIVGGVAIILTVASILITIYYGAIFMNQLNGQINSQLGNQLIP